jgi:hypothetical protein
MNTPMVNDLAVANKARGRDGLPGWRRPASAGVGQRQTALIFLSGGAHHKQACHPVRRPARGRLQLE